jgi:hypothetical protein
VGVHPLDVHLELGIAERPGARLAVLGGVVGGGGDLEYLAALRVSTLSETVCLDKSMS